MADAALNPNVMEEMLRQRGLLATGGNIRSVPFSTSGSVSSGPAGPANGSAVAAQMTGNGAATGAPFGVVDPNAPTPDELAKIETASDDELAINWPAIAGAAAGSALALYLKHLMTKRGIPAPDVVPGAIADPLAPQIPTVEGVVEPTPAIAGGNIQEGQFTDATPRIAGQLALPAPNSTGAAREDIVRALGGTSNASAVAAANTNTPQVEQGATPPKYLTQRALAERRIASQGTPSKTGNLPVRQVDAFTDVAPDEMAHAKKLAAELIKQRNEGIATRTRGKAGPPSLLDPETALHDVIRVMRENGALRSLHKVGR